MDTAKQEAANVVETAKGEASHVAETAKEEAKEVGREARTQASRLFDQAKSELSTQAASQQSRLAGGLRSASDELRGMADSSAQAGVATDLVRQASQRLDGVASWLGDRDPASLLDEVKGYARRRPVMFLAFAALAGVAVGRLTRSLTAGSPDGDGQSRQLTVGGSYATTPGYESGTTYPVGTTGSAYATPVGTTGSAYGTSTYETEPAYGVDETESTSYPTGTASTDPTDPLYRSGEHG